MENKLYSVALFRTKYVCADETTLEYDIWLGRAVECVYFTHVKAPTRKAACLRALELFQKALKRNEKSKYITRQEHDKKKEKIIKLMEEANWCKSRAARLAGVNRKTIYKWLKEIDGNGYKKERNDLCNVSEKKEN